MKIIEVIFAFLLSILFFEVFAQKGKELGVYQAEYRVEIMRKHVKNVDESTMNLLNESNEIRESIPVKLIFNSTKSHFFVDYKPESTSITADFIAYRSINGQDEYFLDLEVLNNVVLKVNNKGSHTYVNDDKRIEWILGKDEGIKINGLEAKFARGKIESKYYGNFEIEAWYLPSIPISTGPIGLYGLPGLIAKLHFKNKIYELRSLSDIRDKNLSLDWPKPDIEVLEMQKFCDLILAGKN